mmetsp:Transcript_109887/g.317702  ORF Transcript_109887/g.317702 Transcript_109887/m.317702 type:complete len:219 (+) Transcript_109887:1068-1724(+)
MASTCEGFKSLQAAKSALVRARLSATGAGLGISAANLDTLDSTAAVGADGTISTSFGCSATGGADNFRFCGRTALMLSSFVKRMLSRKEASLMSGSVATLPARPTISPSQPLSSAVRRPWRTTRSPTTKACGDSPGPAGGLFSFSLAADLATPPSCATTSLDIWPLLCTRAAQESAWPTLPEVNIWNNFDRSAELPMVGGAFDPSAKLPPHNITRDSS